MSDQRISDILHHLNPPPGVQLWHGGATVLGCLRSVTHEAAAWIPAPGRHSIWSLTLHIAYWKYAVRRRLTGEEKGGFPRTPSNWPEVPKDPSADAWKKDRALLRDQHNRLVEAVTDFDPSMLDLIAGDGKTTYADLLWGIVLHDTYHVGQVQLMKRLFASASG